MENELDSLIKDFVFKIHELYDGEPLDGDNTQFIANKVLDELDNFNGNN